MTRPQGHRYLLALGSNMRVGRLGGPRSVLHAAIAELEKRGLDVVASAPIIDSAPIGPSLRRYANTVVGVATDLPPDRLWPILRGLEDDFGRRRGGQRWRARPLDCDIVLWSGGIFVSSELAIPHPHFRKRGFVLQPAQRIAPHWRDPVTGLSVRQLAARLTAPRPVTRCTPRGRAVSSVGRATDF